MPPRDILVRVGRALALAAALALAVGVAPAHARAHWFGYSDNATLSQDLTPAQDANLLARGGANSARIDVDWTWVEQARGKLDLSLYDPIYRAWLQRGVRPLLDVMGSPRWAWPPWTWCFAGSQCHVPPDRSKNAAWGNFVGAVAARFPRAAGIEVWNEPNTRAFFSTGVDPQRYTELLRIASQAVRRVAPGMPVIGGALAPVLDDQQSGDAFGLRPFVQAMYANGARGAMDGISLHPYPRGRPDGAVYQALDEVLAARDEAGDSVPLWLTEVGASTTDGYSERRQATVLGDLIPRLMRRPEVAAVYVHTLLDRAGSDSDPETGFGVLRANGALKPAFCALARSRRGAARCPRPRPSVAAAADFGAQERLQAATESALSRSGSTGSYAGLSTTLLHALDPSLAAAAPVLDRQLGAAARPNRVAVLGVDGDPGAVRLCNASRSGRSFCVTLVPGGAWSYTSARGTILEAAAVPAGGPSW